MCIFVQSLDIAVTVLYIYSHNQRWHSASWKEPRLPLWSCNGSRDNTEKSAHIGQALRHDLHYSTAGADAVSGVCSL